MISKLRQLTLLALLAGPGLAGCVSVKAYQKAYLNDEDMNLADQAHRNPGNQLRKLPRRCQRRQWRQSRGRLRV
jgi:hypothetical protein